MDPFQLAEITRFQNELLARLADDPEDVAIKIAALRSAADLLQQAVTIRSVSTMIAAALAPKR